MIAMAALPNGARGKISFRKIRRLDRMLPWDALWPWRLAGTRKGRRDKSHVYYHMKISSQQSLLQIILLPGEEQTIVTGERLVAPLALLPTVLLLLIELCSSLFSGLTCSALQWPNLRAWNAGLKRGPETRAWNAGIQAKRWKMALFGHFSSLFLSFLCVLVIYIYIGSQFWKKFGPSLLLADARAT